MIWDVRKYTDYRVNPPVDETESKVKSLLYLHVDPAGKAGEWFRFPIFGNRIVTDIWGQDVFEDPEFHHIRFRYEVNAAQVEIRPNTFASKWEDWEEMVIRETLVPIKGPGINVLATEVKKLLKPQMEPPGPRGRRDVAGAARTAPPSGLPAARPAVQHRLHSGYGAVRGQAGHPLQPRQTVHGAYPCDLHQGRGQDKGGADGHAGVTPPR
jgi:hypothetical protein